MEGNNTIQLTQEELDAKINAAVKKRESEQEAGIQKLANEAKLKDKVLDAVGTVSKDPKSLISIAESDEEVANEILKKYYWGKTIEEFKQSINYKEDPAKVTEKLIEEKAKSIYEQDKISEARKSFIEKLWLNWDDLESFDSEFNDRLAMKSFKASDVESHLLKAYKVSDAYNPELIKSTKNTKIAWNNTSIGWGSKTKDDKSAVSKEVWDFLDTYVH